MALQAFVDVMALLWQHPWLSGMVFVLFTPPFFPIVKFFSPLLVSTALFMLALFTVGASESATTTTTQSDPPSEENWEFRRTADVKIWEDKTVLTSPKRRRGDNGWKDWLHSVAESGFAWVETKLRNKNWKGSALNDDNVSILQEATWTTTTTTKQSDLPSSSTTGDVTETATTPSEIDTRVPAVISPSVLFKVDSKLTAELVANATKRDADRNARDVDRDAESLKHNSSSAKVNHEPLETLDISKQTLENVSIDTPSTGSTDSSDLETRKRLLFSILRKNSMNATSGHVSQTPESAIDNPAAKTANDQHPGESNIGNEDAQRVNVPEVAVHSKPTIDVVTTPEVAVHPGSPLFKEGKGGVIKKSKVAKKSGDGEFSDSSSGEEGLDSDSDSEFEIFPPVDPAKMKLHPPVKLDIEHLEKKLGTSLSQRTRVVTPPKGEITEAQ